MEMTGEVCIINIGPRQRRGRMRYGVVARGASVILGSLLIATGVSGAWRVSLFLPLWIGALGVFQARAKT